MTRIVAANGRRQTGPGTWIAIAVLGFLLPPPSSCFRFASGWALETMDG